jgi:hypothetical protein
VLSAVIGFRMGRIRRYRPLFQPFSVSDPGEAQGGLDGWQALGAHSVLTGGLILIVGSLSFSATARYPRRKRTPISFRFQNADGAGMSADWV